MLIMKTSGEKNSCDAAMEVIISHYLTPFKKICQRTSFIIIPLTVVNKLFLMINVVICSNEFVNEHQESPGVDT